LLTRLLTRLVGTGKTGRDTYNDGRAKAQVSETLDWYEERLLTHREFRLHHSERIRERVKDLPEVSGLEPLNIRWIDRGVLRGTKGGTAVIWMFLLLLLGIGAILLAVILAVSPPGQ
jgi:hypothetical protein